MRGISSRRTCFRAIRERLTVLKQWYTKPNEIMGSCMRKQWISGHFSLLPCGLGTRLMATVHGEYHRQLKARTLIKRSSLIFVLLEREISR